MQVTRAGGREPLWTTGGRLLYDTGDSLVAATLAFTPNPTVLRQEALMAMLAVGGYGVHPNGKQFVFQRAVGGDRLEIVVVLNWVTELREKLRQAGKR